MHLNPAVTALLGSHPSKADHIAWPYMSPAPRLYHTDEEEELHDNDGNAYAVVTRCHFYEYLPFAEELAFCNEIERYDALEHLHWTGIRLLLGHETFHEYWSDWNTWPHRVFHRLEEDADDEDAWWEVSSDDCPQSPTGEFSDLYLLDDGSGFSMDPVTGEPEWWYDNSCCDSTWYYSVTVTESEAAGESDFAACGGTDTEDFDGGDGMIALLVTIVSDDDAGELLGQYVVGGPYGCHFDNPWWLPEQEPWR
jgi:hypothetical protein